MRVIDAATDGFNPFIGRNEQFIKAMKWHGEWVFSNATMINALLPFLRPVVGNAVYLWGKYVRSTCISSLLPLVEQRLAKFHANNANPDPDWVAPKDALQWLIEEAYKQTAPGAPNHHLESHRICHRMLLLNFVSMHTTSFTVTNTLQDLFSQPPIIGTAEDLREECIRVFHAHNGVWSYEAVSQLVLLDSTIRESMRISSFSILALPRRVVAKEGIRLADGTHIPAGIPLATPMDAIHMDAAYYTNPSTFHPFRFCTVEQVKGTRTAQYYEEKLGVSPAVPRGGGNKSTVTLDDKFLSFGFGRNACPGRFFALHEMKLMMAYMLMNYEIDYFEKRPEQFKVMWVQLPFESTMLRVRRREGEAIWQKF
jgi:cytochrome P450